MKSYRGTFKKVKYVRPEITKFGFYRSQAFGLLLRKHPRWSINDAHRLSWLVALWMVIIEKPYTALAERKMRKHSQKGE